MTLGLSDRFSILQQSPHDLQADPELEPPTENQVPRWIPSRYNIRAVTQDGRIVLWNSYTGSMSVFGAKGRSKIESLLTRKGFAAEPEGLIKYLSERGFLIQEGVDEFRRIQLGFGQEHYRTDVMQLILLASEDCNFRCTYCYEDFLRGTMKPWVRQGIKRLIERRAGSLRHLSVNWFGGEPLYGFQAIEDLGPFFIEVAAKYGISFSSQMTTNGYLLTPEVATKLLTWKVEQFQITVDGMPEDHDRNRPSRDGQGTFETIFGNLKAMQHRPESFKVNIRFNFDQQTYPKHPEFLDLVEREFGRDPRFHIRFRSVGKWGGANDDQLSVCGTEEVADLEREMKRAARKRGLKLSDEISSLRGLGSQVCYAARPYNFVVGATGKLMKCAVDLDKNDRNVVGQLTETGELLLDKDKFAMWTEPAFENDGKCKKCVMLAACQGVYCPLVRIDLDESPCTPLRSSIKKDLLEVVEGSGSNKKRVLLGEETPSTLPGSSPSLPA